MSFDPHAGIRGAYNAALGADPIKEHIWLTLH